jgi:hypothetical protein
MTQRNHFEVAHLRAQNHEERDHFEDVGSTCGA